MKPNEKGRHDRKSIGTASAKAHHGGFSDCVAAMGEIWIGGQVALDDSGQVMAPGDMRQQTRIVFGRLDEALRTSGATLDDVVKLNLFLASDGADVQSELHAAMEVWADMAPGSAPAMTPVRVYELSVPGLLVQADCVAVTST